MKRILWLFIFVAFCVTGLTKWGFGASSILSNYGQIQNVQNYSSNPFWSPNSPYNKKLPQPVYLQGADLTAGDCQQVVQSLISVQCMTRNNCKNTSLSDIRPAIMVQLSSLSDQHNYASSCAGFIDTIFESYMAQYGNNIPKKTAFPTVSVPSPTTNPNAIELHNPYKIETPEWKQDIIERSQELQNLQQQNGAGNYKLSATAFPKTIDDVSFAEQMANLQEGYAPFKDKSAFHQINVKSLYEYCKSHSDAPECKQYREQQQAQNGNNNGNNGATTPTTNDEKLSAKASNNETINNIVAILDPETPEQRDFFVALAEFYLEEDKKDPDIVLDNKLLYLFLSENNNIDKYKQAFLSVTGTVENDDYGIYLDFEDAKIQVSTIFDATLHKRGAIVCENNRSYSVGIDTAVWVATVVAAVFSFGSGGVAVQGGKIALGQGLKALAKGVNKIGLKSASKVIAKKGSEQLVKAGIKSKTGKALAGAALKTATKKRVKTLAVQAGKNLITKRGLLLATGAVAGTIYETKGKNYIQEAQSPSRKKTTGQKVWGFIYSLVDSDISQDYLNCQDLDKNEKCYMICGQGNPIDDLNTKVFKPLLGRTYCIDPDDYTLYDSSTREPLMLDDNQYITVTQKIRSDVVDKGHCDWNEDDIDMYLGSYIYDPDTMEPSSHLIIEEVIRLDD